MHLRRRCCVARPRLHPSASVSPVYHSDRVADSAAGRARLVVTPQPGFEEHVRRALDALPPRIAQALENVAVVVEEEEPGDPDLFGLWEADEFMPDKITIFRRPLVESFPDPIELERQIRITVLHELGHYFGLDEEQIQELGYG